MTATQRPAAQSRTTTAVVAPRKLSYKDRKELEALPERIDALEAEAGAERAHRGPEFYKEGGTAIAEPSRGSKPWRRNSAGLRALGRAGITRGLNECNFRYSGPCPDGRHGREQSVNNRLPNSA